MYYFSFMFVSSRTDRFTDLPEVYLNVDIIILIRFAFDMFMSDTSKLFRNCLSVFAVT